jgi:hypothetical protein
LSAQAYRNASGVLQSCTLLDTDNDGIPNTLDLDSDGDGCPDSKEAGVSGTLVVGNLVNGTVNNTTSTSNTSAIAAGPYGANGFADGLETASESGLYTYTATYGFATNNVISACSDTDGDGVADINDIDDDNDGILDYDEQESCPALSALTFTAPNNKGTFNGNNLITNNSGTWINNYSNQALSLPIHLEYTVPKDLNSSLIGLIPVWANKILTTGDYSDAAYKVLLLTFVRFTI